MEVVAPAAEAAPALAEASRPIQMVVAIQMEMVPLRRFGAMGPWEQAPASLKRRSTRAFTVHNGKLLSPWPMSNISS